MTPQSNFIIKDQMTRNSGTIAKNFNAAMEWRGHAIKPKPKFISWIVARATRALKVKDVLGFFGRQRITHTVSSENPNTSFRFCAIGGRSRFNWV